MSKYVKTENGYENKIGAIGTSEGSEVFNDYVNNEAFGVYSHAEGFSTQALGEASHAEGLRTQAHGNGSHAEGDETHARGESSHAEGYSTYAEGRRSHAEGSSTHAEGYASHAEGVGTHAIGEASHAEGENNYATGYASHAEGNYTHAEGSFSHVEGVGSHAEGDCSHAEGFFAHAVGKSQHVQGEYNLTDPDYDEENPTIRGKYAHIVGNGDENSRSNAHTLDWEGNAWFSGDVYVGSTSGTNKDEGSVKLQRAITGTPGQVVGFDADGNAVAQNAPSGGGGGVSSVNGQTGDVILKIEDLVETTDSVEPISTKYKTVTVEPASNAASITFDVEEEPAIFSCSLVESATPSSTANILNVIYDGTTVYGMYFNNSTTAYATTYSYNYSNGKLTITCSDSSKGVFGSGLSYKLFYVCGAKPTTQSASHVPASGMTSGSFSITGQPKAFICQMITDVTLSQYHRTSYVIFDGTDTYGLEFHNSIVYSNSSWTWNYNNGTLTITSTSTSVGGYFHNPGDYKLIAIYDGEETPGVEGNSNKFLRGDGTWATVNVEGSGAKVYNAVIGTSWAENSDTGAKTQTVSIDGVLASHTGKLDVVYNGDDTSDSYATFVEAQNQFLEYITNGYAETVNGGVKFTIFGNANTVEIPFILEVV